VASHLHSPQRSITDAYSHAQARASKAARRAGIEYAKPCGNRAYIGRKPSFTREQFLRVRVMLGQETLSARRERNGADATDSLIGSRVTLRVLRVHWRLAGCGLWIGGRVAVYRPRSGCIRPQLVDIALSKPLLDSNVALCPSESREPFLKHCHARCASGSLSASAWRNPTHRTPLGCCASAASCQAAAPPRPPITPRCFRGAYRDPRGFGTRS